MSTISVGIEARQVAPYGQPRCSQAGRSFVDRNHDKSCRSCSEETLLYDILAYEDGNTAALLLGRPGLAETTFLEEKSSNWEIPKRVDTSDKPRCTCPIRPGSVKILLLAPLAFTVQTT